MKSLFYLTLTVPAVVSFAPQLQLEQQQRTTRLSMVASSSPQPQQQGDLIPEPWKNKPLFQKRSTPSVADKPVSWVQRATMEDVVIEPNYFLAVAVALLGPLIMWYHPSYTADGTPSLVGIAGGGFHLLFATLLWVQTRRVRCIFEKDSFEFCNIKGPHLDLDRGARLERKPENYVTGTVNRWKYDTITNYGFFPSVDYPVICYFKETETPKEQWNQWFAAFDSYGRGQPHFFPGICNAHQFKEQMEQRGVKRKAIPNFGGSTLNSSSSNKKN